MQRYKSEILCSFSLITTNTEPFQDCGRSLQPEISDSFWSEYRLKPSRLSFLSVIFSNPVLVLCFRLFSYLYHFFSISSAITSSIWDTFQREKELMTRIDWFCGVRERETQKGRWTSYQWLLRSKPEVSQLTLIKLER